MSPSGTLSNYLEKCFLLQNDKRQPFPVLSRHSRLSGDCIEYNLALAFKHSLLRVEGGSVGHALVSLATMTPPYFAKVKCEQIESTKRYQDHWQRYLAE